MQGINAGSLSVRICVFLFLLSIQSLWAINHQQIIERQLAVLAKDKHNEKARFTLAEVYLDLAGRKEKEYTQKAIEQINILTELHGEKPVYQALLGAARTIQARDAIFYKKMDFLRQGESLLNQAVSKSPNDPRVILLRAITSYKLPRVFGQRKVAEQDFRKLIELINSPDSTEDPALQKVIYFYVGSFLLDENDARSLSYLEKSILIPSEKFVLQDQLDKELKKARKKFL